MQLVPMQAGHLAALQLQPAQAELAPLLGAPGYGETLAAAGPAFAGLVDGTVVGCAGLVLLTQERGHAWALLGPVAPPIFPAVHRAVAAFLAGQNVRRIETAVDSDFAAGHRWAGMLGFAREGRMRAYGPGGRDADLYARIREE